MVEVEHFVPTGVRNGGSRALAHVRGQNPTRPSARTAKGISISTYTELLALVRPVSTMVIAIDGTESSCSAIETALQVGYSAMARLVFVYVDVDAQPGRQPEPKGTDDYEMGPVEAMLRDELPHWLDGYPGLYSFEVWGGTVATAILDLADEVEADMIVVGHERASRRKTTVLGSVSAEVLRRSSRPVTVAIGNVFGEEPELIIQTQRLA